jgi:hypothetical protein
MDPITLITTAAVAGAATIGTTALQESTKHVFKTFIERLRGKAAGNKQAEQALATADDPEAVYKAVATTDAARDPELQELAQQVVAALPQPQVEQTQRQVVQIAKMIQNIERVDNMNIQL